MPLRVFLLRLVARPVLVPVGIGSFGLWYGGFDVAYIVSRKIITSIYTDLPLESSRSNRVISSLAGLSVGSVFAYANASTSQLKNIELPELSMNGVMRQLPSYIKSNIQVLKSVNINRGILLFVCSGFLSGVSKSMVEAYLGRHV